MRSPYGYARTGHFWFPTNTKSDMARIYLVKLLICFKSLIDRVKFLVKGRGFH